MDENFKKTIARNDTLVRITICVGNRVLEVRTKGHKYLTLEDENDIVVRKSDFICPRTLAIGSDKAANDIPKDMIAMLRRENEGLLILSISKQNLS